jgi:hypothetical protein
VALGGGFPPQEVIKAAVKAKDAKRTQNSLDMGGMIFTGGRFSSRESRG